MRDTLERQAPRGLAGPPASSPAPMTACRREVQAQIAAHGDFAKAAGSRSRSRPARCSSRIRDARKTAKATPDYEADSRTHKPYRQKLSVAGACRPRPVRCCAISIPRTSSRNSSPGSGSTISMSARTRTRSAPWSATMKRPRSARMSLGKFRDLLAATVFHPAMLQYLDNFQNAAGQDQRELRPRDHGAAHHGRGLRLHARRTCRNWRAS